MRCRSILLISEHPIQQGIRKGGGSHFCDRRGEDEDEEELRVLVVGLRCLVSLFAPFCAGIAGSTTRHCCAATALPNQTASPRELLLLILSMIWLI